MKKKSLGSVTVSQLLLGETRRTEAAWRDLEWTAMHPDEATLAQRVRLERVRVAAALERWDER